MSSISIAKPRQVIHIILSLVLRRGSKYDNPDRSQDIDREGGGNSLKQVIAREFDDSSRNVSAPVCA